ncbi:hypothetical protein FOCC_FOCC016999 [Frankliniella occidentalis]|nr:hypothetical protein FOCC_FOCC016999 [Frankliniella occidentalis]
MLMNSFVSPHLLPYCFFNSTCYFECAGVCTEPVCHEDERDRIHKRLRAQHQHGELQVLHQGQQLHGAHRAGRLQPPRRPRGPLRPAQQRAVSEAG